MNNKIGIFDSGIGGLTTLKEIQTLLPNESYLFYADSKNNPYGDKEQDELYSIVTNIVEYLISRKVKLIVIACNTATTKCIEQLRIDYPNVTFVGTEPAIKMACERGYKNTLVLATPGTIASERMQQLVEENKRPNENIMLIACDKLANAIENNDEEQIDRILHYYLDGFVDKQIDAVILGCTHYPHVKDKIQTFFKDAVLIDGNDIVAKHVKFELWAHGVLKTDNTPGTIEFIQTKK